jgi:adenine C2-methylase RlmN of 23S rRNA A2503 and tRNA A37
LNAIKIDTKNLIGLTLADIYAIIQQEGFEYRHATAVAHAIYKKRITDLSLSSKIPKKLCAYLKKIADIALYQPVANKVSSDKSVKYLF